MSFESGVPLAERYCLVSRTAERLLTFSSTRSPLPRSSPPLRRRPPPSRASVLGENKKETEEFGEILEIPKSSSLDNTLVIQGPNLPGFFLDPVDFAGSEFWDQQQITSRRDRMAERALRASGHTRVGFVRILCRITSRSSKIYFYGCAEFKRYLPRDRTTCRI